MSRPAIPTGTLLLDPGGGTGNGARPMIWTVTAPRTIISTVEGVVMKGTLTRAGVPKGWRTIEPLELARQLKVAPEKAVEKILSPVAK